VNAAWLAAAIGAESISFVALAQTQRHLLAAGGTRVRLRQMLGLSFEANALTVTLPGGTGIAAGYSLRRYRRWGASTPAAAFAVVASAALSAVAFGALVAVWAVLRGDPAGWAAVGAAGPAAGIAAVAVAQRHRLPRVAAAVGRLVDRCRLRRSSEVAARLERFAVGFGAVRPRRRAWTAGLAHAALNWVADLACLAATCIATDAHLPRLGLVAGAYLAGLAASGVGILPAGIGVVDAAMVGTFRGGGMALAPAARAVLCYRILSVGLVVALGWVLWLRRRQVTR
jgi:uncharacterized protein (TIRG00374 family)